MNVEQTSGEFVAQQRALLVGHLKGVEVRVDQLTRYVILEDDHVGVVDGAMRMMVVNEGCYRENKPLLRDAMSTTAMRELHWSEHDEGSSDDDDDDGQWCE